MEGWWTWASTLLLAGVVLKFMVGEVWGASPAEAPLRSSTVFCLCSSFQSIRAMVLLPTLVSSLWLLCSGVSLANNGGRQRQQQKVDAESTKDLWDLIVIFLLCKVFCVSWCVHLSSLCF